MGLFDFFKKKDESELGSNLSLEVLLQKASTEPQFRPAFYKKLLSEQLVVITNNDDKSIPEGKSIAKENTKVSIVNYPNGVIPVFTSTDRIFDKGVVKEQVQFLKMKGENLFQLAKGATFVLNPYSDYGKELLPVEVESMLNGTILSKGIRQVKIEEDTKVLIGQPTKYPNEIINDLKRLFATKPNIKAAYMAWIHAPETKEPPHYIFGIDMEGDMSEITPQAGAIAEAHLTSDEFVDFIKIDGRGGISEYFLTQAEPFYKSI
ncbi:MAG: enhanced serine sensitivity protein SseB C-terminal domain-containing protein [Bacteroidetes bacterium]|nr:enhanced serine sensitivity protein SseB C-terminal domain-containing protein [Bacteroidota bacterium]